MLANAGKNARLWAETRLARLPTERGPTRVPHRVSAGIGIGNQVANSKRAIAALPGDLGHVQTQNQSGGLQIEGGHPSFNGISPEFAGWTPKEAAVEASRLRLRPILMTSMAFIMGVVPLVFSSGAGAEMRAAMGVAVFAGMLGVTAFGIFLTPVFYVALRRLTGNRPLKQTREGTIPVPAAGFH